MNELRIEFTRTDFWEFNKYVLFKRKFKRHYIIATFFVVLWLIILNLNAQLNITKILLELVIFYAIWTAAIFLMHFISIHRIKNMPDKDGSIIGKKTYIIQEDGLKEITETTESLVKWNGIKRITENKSCIFIFVDKIAAYVIPKRYFNSEIAINEFINLIEKKINK